MIRERRFGKRINEPSTVQIVHELKLMALRQSLDAAVKREAGITAAPGVTDMTVRGSTPPFSDVV